VKKRWKKLSRKKCIIAGGVVILLVVAVTFTAGSRKKGSMAAETAGEIISVEVTKGTIETGVSGTGTLAYGDSTVVTVPEDLEIDEVYVSVGSSVTAGTLLATVNQASLASCLSEVQDAISDLDSTISTQKSKSESTTISAGVAGRVKAIYATEDTSVPDVMKEYGALMLISTDGYMAVDLTGATGLNVGDEVTVSSGDTEASATVESIDGENAVIIFADSKFDIDEELTVTDSDEKSLGTAKAYVHAPLQVVGTNGTVSAIKVSVGSSVSASSTVITLEDTAQTVEYQQAVQERADMVELLNTLISIQTEGGITAKEDGIVEAINADGSTTGTSSSGGMVVGSTSQSAMVAETDSSNNSSSASEDTESVEAVLTDADSSKTVVATTDTVAKVSTSVTASTSNAATGGLMTMSTAALSTNSAARTTNTATQTTAASIKASATAQNTDSKTPLDAPTDLTAGKGVISGTSTNMEYASSEDAEEWTQCTDKTTTVEIGTWYVRYKETQVNAASTAVEVEVTEEADTENNTSNNQNSTGNSTSETQTGTDNGTSGNVASSQNATENNAVMTQSGDTKSGNASSAQTASAQTTASAKSGSGSSASASTSSSTTEDSDALATADVFTIASGDTMTVTMTVDELDILSMEEGQDAVVTVDAVEDQTFNGSITSVNGSASSSGGVAQYSVEVTFEKTADMLAGMSASVEVVLEKAEDVLVVPISAVTDKGRNSVVYTGNSDGTLSDEVEIETGLSDETYVEVVSGLSEGDTIYYQMQGSEDSSSTDQMGGFGGGMPDGDMPGDMNGGKDFDGGKSGGGDMKGMGGGDGNRGGQQ
jgi:hypothetical protein